MKEIILHANIEGVIAFDIAELHSRLEKLEDKRKKRGKIYPLALILTYILLAKLSGQDKPWHIAQWIAQREKQLLTLFDCRHQRVPCLNTIRTILDEYIKMENLETVFQHYLHETYGGQETRLVAIDGKTMRGTIPKGTTQGVHLLAAYLPEEGIVLAQVEVDCKQNEISAAPALLKKIPLKNRVVCADAMQTQRSISVDILSRGGDFIWFVKDNQSTLLQDVTQFFQPARVSNGWHIEELPRSVTTTTNKGHGRIEVRKLTLMLNHNQYIDWPGVQQVFMLERKFTHVRTGNITTEITYGITSCLPAYADGTILLQWIRDYWGIENGLHHRRDVTLQEDATRMSLNRMPAIIATINNFIIGITQKLGYNNLSAARRIFDYQIVSQLFV